MAACPASPAPSLITISHRAYPWLLCPLVTEAPSPQHGAAMRRDSTRFLETHNVPQCEVGVATTEALIAEKPHKKKAGMPDMGGMGGMM